MWVRVCAVHAPHTNTHIYMDMYCTHTYPQTMYTLTYPNYSHITDTDTSILISEFSVSFYSKQGVCFVGAKRAGVKEGMEGMRSKIMNQRGARCGGPKM